MEAWQTCILHININATDMSFVISKYSLCVGSMQHSVVSNVAGMLKNTLFVCNDGHPVVTGAVSNLFHILHYLWKVWMCIPTLYIKMLMLSYIHKETNNRLNT